MKHGGSEKTKVYSRWRCLPTPAVVRRTAAVYHSLVYSVIYISQHARTWLYGVLLQGVEIGINRKVFSRGTGAGPFLKLLFDLHRKKYKKPLSVSKHELYEDGWSVSEGAANPQ